MPRVPTMADPVGQRAIEGSWILDAEGRTLAISPSAAAMLGYEPGDIEGRSPVEFVDEGDVDCITAALERRRHGARESYEVRWCHRNGSTVWGLIAAAPMTEADGTYAGSFAIVTDISGRRRADERLARQAGQQRAVADLGRIALEGADLDRLFDVAVRITAETLGAEYAGVFQHADGRLDPVALHGVPAGSPRDLTLTREDAAPPLEQLLTGELVVIPDWERESEMRQPALIAEHLTVRASVAVPMKGRVLHGVLVAARSTPWYPDEDELRFLEAAAHVLAAALDRADAEHLGRHHALHDGLTGLPNRTLALDRIEQALRRRSEEDAGVLAVVSVDLDRFKRVNDAYGVDAGDAVVRCVAERLKRLVGSADTVARLGGDAFVVVCDDLLAEEAAGAIAARIVEALREPVTVAGEDLALTASIGVALARTGEEEAGALLRDADTAMDRAKARGRDRFELFEDTLRSRAAERVQLERDLHQAIARGELFVAHQPIVSVGSRRVIGTEALARWRHPERGVVPPADFIGLAEEVGLIGDIGLWVLRRACADVAARHSNGHPPLTCHVNLSPLQAADPTLPDRVAAVLEETGLPAESLVLELTESSLMEAGDEPLRVMQAIRELGVRLVLDDFGTGYSSLARLRHFPVDGLKIDRSFVTDLESGEPAGALLVSGIVELARALGLTVVAEGVETEHQLERLERIGCRYAQGFLIARPGDLDALDRRIAG